MWDCTQQESSLRALCLTEQQETRRRKYLEDTRVRMAAVQNPPRLLKSGGTDADPNIRQLQQHHLYPPPIQPSRPKKSDRHWWSLRECGWCKQDSRNFEAIREWSGSLATYSKSERNTLLMAILRDHQNPDRCFEIWNNGGGTTVHRFHEFSIERILRDNSGTGTPGNRYCFTMVVGNWCSHKQYCSRFDSNCKDFSTCWFLSTIKCLRFGG